MFNVSIVLDHKKDGFFTRKKVKERFLFAFQKNASKIIRDFRLSFCCSEKIVYRPIGKIINVKEDSKLV
jgi:hypothetical protein